MATARAALLFAVLAGGCYSPSTPSGAYRCSAADEGCPSGQHCTCGLCVNKDSEAACKFTLSFDDQPTGKLDTVEHQPFPMTVQALAKDGTPSNGFNGTVDLSASWGDVSPAMVKLTNGKATGVAVSLNRETLPPAVSRITARFAENVGVSADVNVKAPPFAVAPTEILPPFGWTQFFVAEPNVVKVGASWRMYFIGQGGLKYGIGVATSTDGNNFVAANEPVFSAGDAYSPATYTTAAGTHMAYAFTGGIAVATSPDGLSAFTGDNNGAPVLTGSSCSYCGKGVTFPFVMEDTTVPALANGQRPLLMFFSAVHNTTSIVSIGRASSTDGLTWTPEPAPLLSGDVTGEAVLLSPRVLIDGTVFKMWYSFARLRIRPCIGTGQSTCPIGQMCVNNLCQAQDVPSDPFFAFCEAGNEVEVGYATSSDGYFWVRSPSSPVIRPDSPGVAANTHALLVSSVIPTDGVNAQKGITLFYSTFRRVITAGNRCVANGITRATRP
jgi:hypothetical protein